MNQKEMDLINASILIRCHQLLDQCPRSKRAIYSQCVTRMKERLEVLLQMNDPNQFRLRAFLGNLMMASTRCYEGYDYTKKPRKVKYFECDPHSDILQAEVKLNIAFVNPPFIAVFDDQNSIKEAKKILKAHKGTLSIICKYAVTDRMINTYFRHHRFFSFWHDGLKLDGLSTYNGKYTFIEIGVVDLVGLIVHEVAHNFPRFFMHKSKPRYISPKKNNRLRFWDEQSKRLFQIEAGDFIENRVFGTTSFIPNPFGLKYRN